MAPKTIASAIPPRPQPADRTARIDDKFVSRHCIAVYRKAAVARLDEFVGPKS
jgi:hypothetical protein